jgi:hypothetical protein
MSQIPAEAVIDVDAISRLLAREVVEEAQVEDPVYRLVSAMVEVNLWIEAAVKHLRLIDQSALSINDRRKINEAIAVVKSVRLGVGITNVVATHTRALRVLGSLGLRQ